MEIQAVGIEDMKLGGGMCLECGEQKGYGSVVIQSTASMKLLDAYDTFQRKQIVI